MKILCRRIERRMSDRYGDIMVDTNSTIISVKGPIAEDECLLVTDSNTICCGPQNKIQAIFDAIVDAEKRGDAFFEIKN